MSANWCVAIFLVYISGVRASTNLSKIIENKRPIIGVLTQEVSPFLDSIYPNDSYTSFIAASYVKFIEGAGARVIPIWIGQEKPYYENLMSKINGVLFPGGGSWFNQSEGYADAGEIIYKLAIDLNEKGDFFPLWGTCLGFELLTYLSDNRSEHRTRCSSDRQTLNLQFKDDLGSSKLFGNAPDDVLSILTNEYVTSNFHNYCITEETLKAFENDWKILSLNDDVNGLKFISSIESQRYPFFGVQFHPEKNLYEWVPNRNISHGTNAITANSYFATFLVSQARKSLHKFDNVTEELESLIYNYSPKYTGLKGSAFEQCYMFSKQKNYEVVLQQKA